MALIVAAHAAFSGGAGFRMSIVWAGLCWEFFELLTSSPLWGLARPPAPVRAGLLLCLAAAGAACAARTHRWRSAAFGVALAGFLAVGAWLLAHTPAPPIDVAVFHQRGAAALLAGENPYTIRIPDIYNSVDSHRYYGPGVSSGGWLTFAFPYPPVSLLLSAVGYALAGDCRYAHLAAMAIAAALMASARPSRLSFAAALLFLFTPRVFLVVQNAWTEPLLVMLLAAFVFCRCRFPQAAPWVAGLLLAAKPYAVAVAPVLLRKRAEFGKAGVVAVLVTAPLALWNLAGFFRSVVIVQFLQPVRADALSYQAALLRFGLTPPAWVAFVLTGIVLALVWRKAPADVTGICAGAALVLLVFFAFNKQAFCNYYYFVIGIMCCGVATAREGDPPAGEQLKHSLFA